MYPLLYNYFRGSGRSTLTGHTTSWCRKTISFHQSFLSHFTVGLFKIYRQFMLVNRRRLTAYAFNSAGLIISWPQTLSYNPYFFHSLSPSLPVVGTTMPLKWIPVGSRICWLAFYARSSGTSLQLLRHRGNLTQVRLPSKKERWVDSCLLATIGINAGSKVKHIRQGKAGDLLFLGRRPSVRGVAMNPVDHPHGGGQGKTSGGRPACSPWGQLSKGYRTTKIKNKRSLKFKKLSLNA